MLTRYEGVGSTQTAGASIHSREKQGHTVSHTRLPILNSPMPSNSPYGWMHPNSIEPVVNHTAAAAAVTQPPTWG